jgi:HEAT repeat protein
MTKGMVILFLLILLTGGGTFAFVNRDALIDNSLTEPYVEKDLTTEEIRSKLLSGDLKQKLAASKQIGKLPKEEKIRVLLKLSGDNESTSRLMAVKKLLQIDDPRVKEKLKWLSENDPDELVRQVAGSK